MNNFLKFKINLYIQLFLKLSKLKKSLWCFKINKKTPID